METWFTIANPSVEDAAFIFVVEFMADNGYSSTIRRLGIPDYFVEHGTQEELIRECGFDAEGIEKAIREMISRE